MNTNTDSPLQVRDVHKSFALHGERIDVLRGADLSLAAGKVTALVGRSGSGKTTLLQIAGLLAGADRGSVRISGRDVHELSDNRRADLRRRSLGFVFQAFNLLPQHTAAKNVALPHLGGGRDAARRAHELLGRVGLGARAGHRPGELSAGEQQRVAVARALVNDPVVVLADEPTGNLDADSEAAVLALFREIARDGRGVLLVTHSEAVCRSADVVIRMSDGVTVPDVLLDSGAGVQR
ncbi:macrolide ABC transporter ATP-binding protein [Actinoplanes philippinensis]|uniref:Putative ABC transport system ATP-binding protein/lipoprotein-releasing system ATP-binding protein n=1 Tax=Actinoplanes philippinensis TaxID=35752 RepID=A0A1I2MA99_9ACTN|nr:ABC transporter ATP-binding protein [Actinoplanes philippinensis]GIE83115.1 macrolide ABC transporter ATP-binding protein [Actinoplanes philippinensis]SFF87729.1 putative ABC transport system ATP-binding protein/lipoprotein-releasing system ATP-binding protein [Actinoplanes philippinensis]